MRELSCNQEQHVLQDVLLLIDRELLHDHDTDDDADFQDREYIDQYSCFQR